VASFPPRFKVNEKEIPQSQFSPFPFQFVSDYFLSFFSFLFIYHFEIEFYEAKLQFRPKTRKNTGYLKVL
jgi:hypothetical protein